MPALTAGKFYFFQVPLIYWKCFACLRTAESVDMTFSLSRKHRAGEKQIAAGAALATAPFAGNKLALDIVLSKMDQPQTSEFARGVYDKARILKIPTNGRYRTAHPAG